MLKRCTAYVHTYSKLLTKNLLGQALSLSNNLLNVTNHVEGSLREVIKLTTKNGLEALNGVRELDKTARRASEDLSDLEGLRQETLDLTGTGDGELILLGQLIHTQNGNNILERLVVLEDLLDTTGSVVVLLTDNAGVENTRGRVEGIDGGVNTQLSNTTRQHSGSIQVSEGGGRGGISKIVGGHVNGLHGGNGTLLGGGNTLLHSTHVGGEGWLVTDSGGNTTEKGRHLGTGLSETENVVDEEKHVLTLEVTEVLSNGETSEGDTGTSTRGLVHLTVHKGSLRTRAVQLDHTRLDHLVVEIVTLTGTLTDTSEHGVTTVGLGNVVDKLHNEHSLTDTGTTEETDLTTLGIGGEEIDDLDTSDKDLSLSRLVSVEGSLSVNGEGGLGVDRTTLIDGLTNHVNNATKSLVTDGDGDGGTSVEDGLTTDQTLSTVHGNSTDSVLTQVLGNLQDEAARVVLNLKSVQNGGKGAIELNVDDGTDDLEDLAVGLSGGSVVASSNAQHGGGEGSSIANKLRDPMGRDCARKLTCDKHLGRDVLIAPFAVTIPHVLCVDTTASHVL
eukprot:Colp12_sorted_trinity150504_noHs@24768